MKLFDRLHGPTDRSLYLAFFRVFIAFHLLKKLLLQMSSVDLLFGPDSFVTVGDPLLSRWLDVAAIQSNIRLVLAAYSVVIVLYAFGIGKHFTALALFLFLELMQRLNGYVLNGGDNLLKFLMLYMVFADSYQHLSLMKLRIRNPFGQKLSNLCTNLAVGSMMFHLALVYFMAGLHKAHADVWFNGVATYYTLQIERFMGTPMNTAMAQNGVLVTLSTYGTLIWELGFIFVIWNRRVRPYVLAMGLALHFGIYALMMIYDFQIVFVMTYGFFFSNADLRSVAGRIGRSWSAGCGRWLHRSAA